MPRRNRPKSDSLAEYWKDILPKGRNGSPVEPAFQPDPESLVKWTASFDRPHRQAFLVLPESPRVNLYQEHEGTVVREDLLKGEAETWIEAGVVSDVEQRLVNLGLISHGGPSSLLWSFVQLEHFSVQEGAQLLADDGRHLTHQVFRTLWEARFIYNEQGEEATHSFLTSMGRWMLGRPLTEDDSEQLSRAGVTRRIESDRDRVAVLLFLLTLGAQNHVLDWVLLTFDGLEKAAQTKNHASLQQLDDFLGDLEYWVCLGCPLGILLTFPGSAAALETLAGLHASLATRVANAVG